MKSRVESAHWYAVVTIGSFLLFAVQPILGKHLLPFFGSSFSVWSVTLTFFTTALCGGYWAAYRLVRLDPKKQIVLHRTFALIAVASVIVGWIVWNHPLLSEPFWNYGKNPTVSVLLLLSLGILLPYLVLSMTSILAQAWSGMRNPYRLYALSNGASFAGLLIYPFFVEPFINVSVQAVLWTGLFCVYIGLLFFVKPKTSGQKILSPAPELKTKSVWFLLSLLAAFLLTATTTKITVGISSLPLMWVLPLAVYLLAFVVSFAGKKFPGAALFALAVFAPAAPFIIDAPAYILLPVLLLTGLLILIYFILGQAYRRPPAPAQWLKLTLSALFLFLAVIATSFTSGTPGLLMSTLFTLTLLFLSVFFLISRTYEQRPSPDHLPAFYLIISIGGAVGTIAASILAPALLRSLSELAVGLSVLTVLLRKPIRTIIAGFPAGHVPIIAGIVPTLIVAAALTALIVNVSRDRDVIAEKRTFYGIHAVKESDDTTGKKRQMFNGIILHGTQYRSEILRILPTTYFGEKSGAGIAFGSLAGKSNRHIGIIGLGTGTLAAYCKTGDTFRYYEIDPAVIDFARRYFTYLSDCESRGGSVETAVGDGRVTLDRENDREFDLFIMDAFTDDSIPLHLLTKEAFETYRRHLAPGGVIAVHISNNYLDLAPVVAASAKEAGLSNVFVDNPGTPEINLRSLWVIVGTQPFIDSLNPPGPETLFKKITSEILWTDERSSMLSAITFPYSLKSLREQISSKLTGQTNIADK